MIENTKSKIDIYDGEPWSITDLWDLQNSLEYGSPIEEVAVFLCRAGSVDEVRRKADALGLNYVSRPLPPPVPTRKITRAEVITLPEGRFGVAYEFDDGDRITTESESERNRRSTTRATGSAIPFPSPGRI